MDWVEKKRTFFGFLKKYRYVAAAMLAGMFLMLLPVQETAHPQIIESEEKTLTLQESLEDILSQIYGAGNVKVLLTQAEGERTIYQMDRDISSQEERRDTVLVTNGQREETGLVQQIHSPVYQGAVILCQGADNANVRLGIVEAVMCVTGLTSDHISVLKMK